MRTKRQHSYFHNIRYQVYSCYFLHIRGGEHEHSPPRLVGAAHIRRSFYRGCRPALCTCSFYERALSPCVFVEARAIHNNTNKPPHDPNDPASDRVSTRAHTFIAILHQSGLPSCLVKSARPPTQPSSTSRASIPTPRAQNMLDHDAIATTVPRYR